MKLWGGRFSGKVGLDSAANSFHSSIMFDQRLYKYDIIGSIAHAEMLGKQGIISAGDSLAIVEGLRGILADIESRTLEITPDSEDIHSFVEAELISRIGDAGRRLHTGRSRNDQVALDMRMYVREEIGEVKRLVSDLLGVILDLSKSHTKTIMPGFTHLQKAQPLTLAHHLMCYFQMFKRDYRRLNNCFDSADEMPLGSGALAATTYPLNRDYVRENLDFSRLTENSLDGVSDRDFCIEFIFVLSLIMLHLSRFCEELILWASEDFGFVEMSDAYSTGSSIMPQKKNPDMAELIRGKTGRVYGSLVALLTTMKSLPLAYNKDMQEDKEATFDAVDTVKSCLGVFVGMISTAKFNVVNMRKSAKGGYTNATDAADWLVKKGVAFREAHEISGKLVLLAIDKGVCLDELSLDDFKRVSEAFDESVYAAISLEECVNSRSIIGAPAESAVLEAIKSAEAFLQFTASGDSSNL
ncbi:MAG: argininosuccinate lyase [Oscillospiraceae bacterium]|nr:argininosuccinate lyase [Oscillospiraceae bacterium]